jgi:hypothetical protein
MIANLYNFPIDFLIFLFQEYLLSLSLQEYKNNY